MALSANQYILQKRKSDNSAFEEKTFTPEAQKVLGFSAGLDPVMKDLPALTGDTNYIGIFNSTSELGWRGFKVTNDYRNIIEVSDTDPLLLHKIPIQNTFYVHSRYNNSWDDTNYYTNWYDALARAMYIKNNNLNTYSSKHTIICLPDPENAGTSISGVNFLIDVDYLHLHLELGTKIILDNSSITFGCKQLLITGDGEIELQNGSTLKFQTPASSGSTDVYYNKVFLKNIFSHGSGNSVEIRNNFSSVSDIVEVSIDRCMVELKVYGNGGNNYNTHVNGKHFYKINILEGYSKFNIFHFSRLEINVDGALSTIPNLLMTFAESSGNGLNEAVNVYNGYAELIEGIIYGDITTSPPIRLDGGKLRLKHVRIKSLATQPCLLIANTLGSTTLITDNCTFISPVAAAYCIDQTVNAGGILKNWGCVGNKNAPVNPAISQVVQTVFGDTNVE